MLNNYLIMNINSKLTTFNITNNYGSLFSLIIKEFNSPEINEYI